MQFWDCCSQIWMFVWISLAQILLKCQTYLSILQPVLFVYHLYASVSYMSYLITIDILLKNVEKKSLLVLAIFSLQWLNTFIGHPIRTNTHVEVTYFLVSCYCILWLVFALTYMTELPCLELFKRCGCGA